jgi:hypothetical protein
MSHFLYEIQNKQGQRKCFSYIIICGLMIGFRKYVTEFDLEAWSYYFGCFVLKNLRQGLRFQKHHKKSLLQI